MKVPLHCSTLVLAKRAKHANANAGVDASHHSSPSKRKPIHPSSPKGASWGSRHAQHIGNKPSSGTTGKGKKDPQESKVNPDVHSDSWYFVQPLPSQSHDLARRHPSLYGIYGFCLLT